MKISTKLYNLKLSSHIDYKLQFKALNSVSLWGLYFGGSPS